MNSKQSKEWIREFRQFLQSEEVTPPRDLTETVFSKVKKDLHPSLKLVLSKLFALHSLMAFAITLVCPQLGVSSILGFDGLHHFFMRFGALPCAALCGALFLGPTALVSVLVLKTEELRLANRYRFINVSFLAAISLSGLMVAGGEADQLSYAFWIAGAILAGWIILGAGSKVRLQPPLKHGYR